MHFSLVAGLGNPDSQYTNSRHNLGFIIVDHFASTHSIPWQSIRNFKASIASGTIDSQPIKLAKPLNYMNNSGSVLQQLLSYFKIPPEKMLVIYDDINIDLGNFKISLGGSAGGHNGVQDIIDHCSNTFTRLRLGIGQKQPKDIPLTDYVLGNFSPNENSVLTSALPTYIKVLSFIIKNGSVQAMTQFNQTLKNS